MRVTNDTLRQAFLAALQASQERLLRTQTQLTTGRRITRPSQDPLAAARIQDLEAAVSQLDQYQRNGDTLRNRLSLEESVLTSAGNLLQRARELAVQGNNATQSNETRASAAVELREILDALVDLANTRDSGGRYLFSGYKETTQPFVLWGLSVAYVGDQGQRQLQVGDNRTIADVDSGAEVFTLIKNGNGKLALSANAANTGSGVLGAGSIVDPSAYVPDVYTVTFVTATDYEVRDSGGGLVAANTFVSGSIGWPGVLVELQGSPAAGDAFVVAPSVNQDVFATLSQLIVALETPVGDSASQALLNNNVGQRLPELDQAIGHLVDIRADVGARLKALDDQGAINADFSLQLTDTLSGIRDLDYAEAISRLNQELFGLETAQATFARLQSLSLFRFL